MFDLENDFDDELEWFCESSSTPMCEDDTFNPFQQYPNLAGGSTSFLDRVPGWRERLANHSIFNCDFEGFNQADNDSRTFAQVIFSTIDAMKDLICNDHICIVGYSGGKDSSVLVTFLNLAYAELYHEGKLGKLNKRGVLVHATTLVENVEIEHIAATQWNSLKDNYFAMQLPVDQLLTRPTFSSSFFGRIVTGRGLPTTVTSSSRDCSIDWKVKPNTKAIKQHLKQYGQDKNKAVLFLGSRDDEGAVRSASIKRNGGTDDPLAVSYLDSKKMSVCYPIKDMKVEHIWEILTCAGTSATKVIPSILDFEETIVAYAASSGECVMMETDESNVKNSKPCSARHGCWTCAAGGETDKSLEQMLKEPKYGYMKQLNRIRNYIVKDHNNWSNRSIWNRSIDKYGFVKIQPDLYSFSKCRTILKALLSADVLERERAYEVEMAVLDGKLPRNKETLRFSKPQFQLVSKRDLIRIDYLWNFHQHATAAFSAFALWDEVKEQGNLELLEWVDDMAMCPPSPQPPAHYIYCGSDWSDGGANPGLVDYMAELVAFDPSSLRFQKQTTTGKAYEIMDYDESDSIDVDLDRAWYFEDSKQWRHDHDIGTPPTLGALTLLRQGIIKPARNGAFKSSQMAMRYQWHKQRGLHGEVSYIEFESQLAEFEKKAKSKIYTQKEYRNLCKDLGTTGAIEEIIPEECEIETLTLFQTDLFDPAYDTQVTFRAKKPKKGKGQKSQAEPQKIEGQLSIF